MTAVIIVMLWLIVIFLVAYVFATKDNQAKQFRKVAEQGIANAQYNMGVSYRGGIVVKQDFEKAVYWFRKAVLQGDEMAQSALEKLGVMYEGDKCNDRCI